MRARAATMPSAKPPAMAGMASFSVPPPNWPMPSSPCTSTNCALETMTPQSNIDLEISSFLRYHLSSSCSWRLFKRVQMQGGARAGQRRRWALFSSLLMLGGAGAGDHAGYRESALHARHEDGDAQAEPQVEGGPRREGLDALGGVGLDLAGLERHLGHADGEGQGRVLEEVQALVGEGRDDQAQGHGEDDVPVGLGHREAGGEGGL